MSDQTIQILIILGFIWSVPWKGVALWKASRLSHKKWFIILLILNTFAILEIYYIYFVAKKYTVEEVVEVENK
jgi:hypothetical protein